MCKKLVFLALVISVCGLGTVRAEDWKRVAYWDGSHVTNWINEGYSVALRDGLSAAGYEVLNANQLKTWMDARIADGALSVVVMCRDNGPDTICETIDENCTLRKYLNAGGKIVWPGDIPFWNITHSDGTTTNYGTAGSPPILGFYAANGQWDSGNTVTITEAGAAWGLTETWSSARAAASTSVDVILAQDDSGYAAAWVKFYVTNDTFRGFVRTLDVGAMPNIEDIIRLAEFKEAYPFAAAVNPADGAVIDSTECTLQWKAGDYATSHNVYFTDDLAALKAGQVEPVSTTETSLTKTDLVRGKTYYWRVDEVAEGNLASPWEGAVWSFTFQPATAWSPTPADGAVCVATDQTLTWTNGLSTIFSVIYMGESYDEVDNATMFTSQSVDPTFTPDALEAGKTYYWRVDEFIGASTVKGEVWSFTTVPQVAVSDSHLVGWWTFDEVSSNTAIDSSGYGNHGTLIAEPERVEGFEGGALRFGLGKYVNCGTDAASGVSGDFTLSAWVKNDRVNAGIYGGIAGKLVITSSNYYGFALVRHTSNYFRLWVADGTTDLAKSAVSSDVTYTDAEWHHVAGVHSGLINSLYVDGVKQAGSSSITFVPSTDFFHIGRQYSHSDDRYFRGVVDDVRIYDTAASAATIATIMEGRPNNAGDPEPANGAVADIRDLSDLAWSAGDTAASHDVYFGASYQAVANADHSSAEFKGNQSGTSMSVADLVTFGGGDYYWRVDEVAADGTAYAGYVWKFTMPAYLPVDDFEVYDDNEPDGTTIYQAWTDGLTNGTGSYVGYGTAVGSTFSEIRIVHSGTQSMPLAYANADAPYYSEAEHAFDGSQDWTVEGVDTLCLFVRGALGNAAETLYVGLQDSTNTVGVVTVPETSIVTTGAWTRLRIPLADFGVKTTAIKKMYIGVGSRNNPVAGGAGTIYIDDIYITK